MAGRRNKRALHTYKPPQRMRERKRVRGYGPPAPSPRRHSPLLRSRRSLPVLRRSLPWWKDHRYRRHSSRSAGLYLKQKPKMKLKPETLHLFLKAIPESFLKQFYTKPCKSIMHVGHLLFTLLIKRSRHIAGNVKFPAIRVPHSQR